MLRALFFFISIKQFYFFEFMKLWPFSCIMFENKQRITKSWRYCSLQFFLYSFILIFFSSTFQISATKSVEDADYRLPTSLYPLRYHIRLFVALDPLPGYPRFTATGDISIQVKCTESTDRIYLHAANLSIAHDTVQVLSDSSSEDLSVTSLTYVLQDDFFIINLNTTLKSDETYTIKMHYVAPIPDYRLNGMYQDYYQDPETSETRYIATTLFAPIHSRRLFPNFDEPSFRANYTVEIVHHKKYHAMANEEILTSYQIPDKPDYVADVFKTTPNISSYISAMIVSDFTYETATENRFPDRTVRIYAAPHLIALGAGEYAANVTDAVMGFLESRFQIRYPLNKLYSIALPHFFFSAMENIGMITYKEPVLLYLKNETTEEERYTINSVMSHELSHQWFGNIVACRFWSWVWLKEGFSTFYSHYGINHTNPELNPWEMFIPNVAMAFDSTDASHPLENIPPTSAAVLDIYTTIPYNKGASINRMTSTFLTENVFEQAMKIYVNRHQYSSADQYDLFDALQEALDQNPLIASRIPTSIKEIMNSWTLQAGFPIITATRIDSSHIQLTQKKFTEGGSSNSSTTWWVPVTLQPRSQPDLPGTVPDTWIPQGVSTISIEVTTGENVIINPDATGYYRVQYDDSLRLGILELLETDHLSIPAAGRSKLIDDYFQLALSEYVPIEFAMDFIKYTQKDLSTAVWLSLQSNMDKILRKLRHSEDNEIADLLKEYLLAKVEYVWDSLPIAESSSGSMAMLYELLIRWSCQLGSCLAFTDEEVLNFSASSKDWQVPKEQQFSMYCAANSRETASDRNVFDYILSEFSNPKTLFGRRQRLLKAMACTKDVNKLKWLVHEAFDEESVYFSASESGQLLQLLAKESTSAELILDMILENTAAFFSRYDNSVESILLDMGENLGETRIPQVRNLIEQVRHLNPERAKRISALLGLSMRQRALLSNSLALKLKAWLVENM